MLHSCHCFHNLEGKDKDRNFVAQKQVVLTYNHFVPKSILTSDLVNLVLPTSCRVVHRLQQICQKYFISVVTVSIINFSGGQSRL